MKKFVTLMLAALMLLSVVACGGAKEPETYEIAMVTDIGTIDDKSFNQGTWEGIVAYCEEKNITHKYYKPAEGTTDACLAAIELAVENGAKVVVTPGFLFEETIFKAQDMYPEVMFIFIDGEPHSGDYTEYRIEDNVLSIYFAEEQVGFMCGYFAVKGGHTNLGFMGGMAVPAVVRFGYGYVQGAEAAAKELGIEEINMNYYYTGNFDATPEAQAKAAAWYEGGTTIIFGCGGAVGNSVMAAAEAGEGRYVIGVDGDQSGESETVVTSAMKGLGAAVEYALEKYYAGEFPGGQIMTRDAAGNGVRMPVESTKLDNFTEEAYNALYAKLADGSIVVKADDAGDSPEVFASEIIKIVYEK